jgi:hypothetical protein
MMGEAGAMQSIVDADGFGVVYFLRESGRADERLESYLKYLFRPARIRGEWFEATDDLIACVGMLDDLERARHVSLLFKNNPTKGLTKKRVSE